MPDWDNYFLGLAKYVSEKSKDPSTKTGAVIVRPDRTICSVGYNGFPRRLKDDSRLGDRETKYKLIIHCEMNALLHSREPICGYTLYTYPFSSCTRCCVHMIQAGISRAVFPVLPDQLRDRWSTDVAEARSLYTEAGVEWTEL